LGEVRDPPHRGELRGDLHALRHRVQREEQAAHEAEDRKDRPEISHRVLRRERVADGEAQARHHERAQPGEDAGPDEIAEGSGDPHRRADGDRHDHRQAAEHETAEDLDEDVHHGVQRGEAQLPAPALRAFRGHRYAGH
ncbi:hypothetical protein ABE10_01570, partial [Bacillus toyonensis]|nr:hypothetical protein [Bacillus toyonensis]